MLGNLDWWLLIMYFILVLIGWLHIWSAGYSEDYPSPFDPKNEAGKQLLWMGASLIAVLIFLLIDSKLFQALRVPIFIAVMLLLASVLVIGQEVGGNKSWIVINSYIKIQPAEFGKFATALLLAGYIGGQYFSPRKTKSWLIAFAIVSLPAALILGQDDFGSALVYFAFILAMFRFGLNWWLLIVGISVGGIFLFSLVFSPLYISLVIAGIGLFAYLIFLRDLRRSWIPALAAIVFLGGLSFGSQAVFQKLKPTHQNRIKLLFDPDLDPKGKGWNVTNSKIALSVGGLNGKGFMKGSLTQLKFVPKQHTDFIFSAIGEQWGFAGTTTLILLFMFFLFRLLKRAERQKTEFARVFGYCVTCIIFFHFFMNVGTALGIVPTVGVPLPFISYGGSSLLGFSMLVAAFLRMDAQNAMMLR
jgi:rod shape determining protein RodA